MYAVKVLLRPSPWPAAPEIPGLPVVMPGDRELSELAEQRRTDPQPGIVHVALAHWGGRLVGMTFVEATDLDEALFLARHAWDRWLSRPGALPGWVMEGCEADRYLNARRREPPPPRGMTVPSPPEASETC
ncbi:hypothetical protein [Streptomyces sp. NPDC013187]|uniref:hypothetical protein n=1 Tax=Streptomyces sp. NPDC013187 TaxID=3364865 RepID=UPI00367E6B8F